MAATTASRPSEGKRTYHDEEDSAYPLPNDSTEHDRLDEQHRGLVALMNGNIHHVDLSSLPSSPKILDIGCGTGVVTTSLANHFPDGRVYGADLSRVPNVHGQPKNVQYVAGDIKKIAGQYPLDNSSFDYIWSRLLVGGMSDWPLYMRTCAELLNPGGWIEQQEYSIAWYDAEGKELSKDWKWYRATLEHFNAHNVDWHCATKLEQYMKDAGLVDGSVKAYDWNFYIDPAPGREAANVMARTNLESLPHAFYAGLARIFDGVLSPEQIKEYQEECAWNLRPEHGKHCVYTVTTGRKPMV